MVGGVKPKEYKVKDSNMENVGTKMDRDVKKAAAETEPAWEGAGEKVGLEVWRINNFKVERWPEEDKGYFYDGDSFIIMHTYQKPDQDAFDHDLHFWIGKDSTQDEYGTAAYKTVELDTLLDDRPVQHREVMNHESKLFLSYFPTLVVEKGGVKSGFNKIEKVSVNPKLYHFHGDRHHVGVQQVSLNLKNLDKSDVFILETNDCIYQWNGETCNHYEKFHAMQYLQELRRQRSWKVKTEVLDDPDIESDHTFFHFFSDDNPVDFCHDTASSKNEKECKRRLFKLSDETGKMKFSKVGSGDEITMDKFDSMDVFIFDKPDHCYVWVGKGASTEERKSWPYYSGKYLDKKKTPWKPVTMVKEGLEPPDLFD